jgi:simple sugar transport system substrate-binding protein
MWADPHAISYIGLSMALMAYSGIPPGFDVFTGTLYEADKAEIYLNIMSGS